MKITKNEKREIIRKHVEEKIPLSYLARKYNINCSNLDCIYSFYLKRGDETFEQRYGNFTTEERILAVQRVLNGESLKAVAIDYKLGSVQTLKKRKEIYLSNSCKIVTMKQKGKKSLIQNINIHPDDEKTLKQLREENLRLRAELDYIKKLRALREEKSQQLKKK